MPTAAKWKPTVVVTSAITRLSALSVSKRFIQRLSSVATSPDRSSPPRLWTSLTWRSVGYLPYALFCKSLLAVSPDMLPVCQIQDSCHEHRKSLEYYCDSCSIALCSDCAVISSTHRGDDHNVLPLRRANNAKRSQLESVRQRASNTVSLLQQSSKVSNTSQAVFMLFSPFSSVFINFSCNDYAAIGCPSHYWWSGWEDERGTDVYRGGVPTHPRPSADQTEAAGGPGNCLYSVYSIKISIKILHMWRGDI